MEMREKGKCILVVDDEPIHRMGIRDRLEHAGYEVDSAEGGDEALQMLQEMEFDLVILDLLMPRPNGFDVFEELKVRSVASRIPILILTVVGLEPRVQALIAAGAHYLQKHHAPQELVPRVRELLNGT